MSSFLLDLMLPLPALLHVLNQSFPNFNSPTIFRCTSYENYLKEVDSSLHDPLVVKVENSIKILKKLNEDFPQHFCSDAQVIIHLIIQLIHRWLDQKRVLCFVPLTFTGKNSFTIYIPNSSPMVISECVSASRASVTKDEKKSLDSSMFSF